MTTKYTTMDVLVELTAALDNAFISSWQSTAGWQRELDRAKEYIAAERVRNAAPDLLEALIKAQGALEIAHRKYGDVGGSETDWGVWEQADSFARAAIAKATGESNG
ncbi:MULTISPECIES: hypothetical protein [unclassified Achromobacter]|uniref:hypothetical protein n=1 Tax=unclassified Achromobacter TaxID=2626865 RepID=UPI000B515FAA|nr:MULTISPECIES: hypothetical protein [unclassified Achromobacter]OWT68061.1 hypothetical protein CEY05_28930 [Achromobacter sp. HZ34]OWT69898.1 hypothetical protein CEY04_27760 [Achromobacter sp. HZ28]